MKRIDKFLANWCKQNGVDFEEYVSGFGLPSESPTGDDAPDFQELQHILNTEAPNDLQLPPEITAYKLSRWLGTPIDTNHTLVQNREKWLEVYYNTEYGVPAGEDATLEKQLVRMVFDLATGDLKENIDPDYFDEVIGAPQHTGKYYMVPLQDRVAFLNVNQDTETVAIMMDDGEVRIYDFNGHRLHQDSNMDMIKHDMMHNMKISKPVTEPGELASLIGNNLSDLITGAGGNISILDLP